MRGLSSRRKVTEDFEVVMPWRPPPEYRSEIWDSSGACSHGDGWEQSRKRTSDRSTDPCSSLVNGYRRPELLAMRGNEVDDRDGQESQPLRTCHKWDGPRKPGTWATLPLTSPLTDCLPVTTKPQLAENEGLLAGWSR